MTTNVPRSPLRHTATKFREDDWCSNPPRVASYLSYPLSKSPSPNSRTAYISPICGFGWRFEIDESFTYQTPASNPQVQELVGQTKVFFQPHLCSSMPLSNISATVKVTYPDADDTSLGSERTFPNIAIHTPGPSREEHNLGTYSGPPQYKGNTHIEVAINFNPSDGLSLPNSSTANTKKALRRSLDTASFVDTKFYLFSSKIDGLPAHPRELFVKSELLIPSCAFFKDMLSQDTGFSKGTPCDLLEDVPEEMRKLEADSFDHDSASDLEEEVAGIGKKRNAQLRLPKKSTHIDFCCQLGDCQVEEHLRSMKQRIRPGKHSCITHTQTKSRSTDSMLDERLD
ncbi:hypothetical protein NP233_g9357 [Leucocoprinus birnbaumii]|uniref:Uncharacterized protein n=1 Tax=Leucocoprinus birnbaumii TaxID=56174 RepID=A0AAD5VL64_9AGAR|nr:hypothetical protein NP233_g9357 [Leucocoprinus birnbaumii]